MAKTGGAIRRRGREKAEKINTPARIPSGWIVFNAFRPLMGTILTPGNNAIWQDAKGKNGIHFAAVNPNDPMADLWIKNNKRQKAIRVGTS